MTNVALRDKPLHLQVRERIERMLVKHRFSKDASLPTYRELSRQLHVSLVTIQRAMDELTKEGLVYGRPGKGTFLARDLTGSRKLKEAGLVVYGSRQLFFESPWLMEIFRGIMLRAELLKASVHIFSIKSEGRLSADELRDSEVDGALLLGVANDGYIAELADAHKPLVVVDYCTDAIATDFVVADNHAAARKAVEHLFELGHRRIAYVGGYSTDTTLGLPEDPIIETSDVRERRESFQSAAREFGLSDTRVFDIGKAGPQISIAAATEALAHAVPRYTAVVTYDTSIARLLLQNLEQRGLHAPRDISIAAVAGAGDGQFGACAITHNRVNFIEMGKTAVDLLERQHREGLPRLAHNTRIGSTFVPGNTSGPAENKGATL